jgi:hypothetical protein
MVNTLGFGKQYRSIKFLKDRLAGLEGTRLGVYFNGAVPYCEELEKIQKGVPQILPQYPNDPLLRSSYLEYKKNEK